MKRITNDHSTSGVSNDQYFSKDVILGKFALYIDELASNGLASTLAERGRDVYASLFRASFVGIAGLLGSAEIQESLVYLTYLVNTVKI